MSSVPRENCSRHGKEYKTEGDALVPLSLFSACSHVSIVEVGGVWMRDASYRPQRVSIHPKEIRGCLFASRL